MSVTRIQENFFVLKNAQALLTIQHNTPVRKQLEASSKIAYWGSFTNSFPQDVEKDIRLTPVLSGGLNKKVNMLVGGGIVYGYTSIDETTGEEKLIPVNDLKIEKWNKQTNTNLYVRDAAHEFYRFWTGFVKNRMNKNNTFITNLEVQESMWCRLALNDSKTGAINKCYVNANWDEGATHDSKETITYPLLDPYSFREEQVRAMSGHEFIYPISGTSSGDKYYPLAPWDSIRQSKWLKVLQAIPTYKINVLIQQYSIKFHFILNEAYFPAKVPGWDKMTIDEKNGVQNALLASLDEKFKGVDKAGNSILSIASADPLTKKLMPWLEIIAIDDKIKSGMYIEDSQEATMQAALALGIDLTLIGPVPGKGTISTGTDKRVAYNMHLSDSKSEQDLILEPLLFAYDFNGFSKPYEDKGGLKIWFRNFWVTTLDKGKETQQQSS